MDGLSQERSFNSEGLMYLNVRLNRLFIPKLPGKVHFAAKLLLIRAVDSISKPGGPRGKKCASNESFYKSYL